MSVDLRTRDLKKIIEAFEQERDKLLDQVQHIKGHADRMEWVIKVLMGQVDRIEKEEKQRQIMLQQQEEAMKIAKEKGNVGVHPSEKPSITERRHKKAASPETEENNLNKLK